jgi:hypothetical protein
MIRDNKSRVAPDPQRVTTEFWSADHNLKRNNFGSFFKG